MKAVLVVIYTLSAHKMPSAVKIPGYISALREYGWEPVILTHASYRGSNAEDAVKLPEDIDIICTGSISTSRLPQPVKTLSRLVTGMLHERQAVWEFLTLRKAIRIAKSGGADLICTISPPYTSHLVGLHLRKRFPNLPWVADFSASRIPVRTHEKKTAARITDSAEISIPADSEIQIQELSELFEKACRIAAARKLENT